MKASRSPRFQAWADAQKLLLQRTVQPARVDVGRGALGRLRAAGAERGKKKPSV